MQHIWGFTKMCYINSLLLLLLLLVVVVVVRGMTTLPQGKQELLVVRDKVGRLPGELQLQVSKSMECDIFPSVL